MKLYLKQNQPKGHTHYVLDGNNYQAIKPGYLLFPDKCEDDIPDEKALLLLKQNPAQISTEPFEVMPPALEKPTSESMAATLLEIAHLTPEQFAGLSRKQITEYADRLDVKIKVTLPTAARLEMLNQRCKELSEAIS